MHSNLYLAVCDAATPPPLLATPLLLTYDVCFLSFCFALSLSLSLSCLAASYLLAAILFSASCFYLPLAECDQMRVFVCVCVCRELPNLPSFEL